MLPEGLLDVPATDGHPVASRLEAQLAWAEVVRSVPLDGLRAVFPVDPPVRSFAWALGLAKEFQRLQRLLGESGLTFAAVPRRVGTDFPEFERWRQLATLERLQREALAARGLRDPQAVWVDSAQAPMLPEGVARVALLGLPDPLPLALNAITKLGTGLRVDVAVFAPASESAAFDAWGRPVEDAWARRRIEFPDIRDRVHICADPAAQAERLTQAVDLYGGREDVVALGTADPEVIPPLQAALARKGLAAYNPEGEPFASGGLYQLLAALSGLATADTFASTAALARCPDFLRYLEARVEGGFSSSEFLAMLDDLHERHLPVTLKDALRHRPGHAGLRAIADLQLTLAERPFVESAAAVPAQIFASRRFALGRDDDVAVADEASAWMDVVRACASAQERFGAMGMKPAGWWEIALGIYGEVLRYAEKQDGAVEVQGWLELLWEDAPHLLVSGLNEGKAPEAVTGDPFLPESLRVRLGLKTNARRFARDAYYLSAIAACRSAHGRLDLLVGRASTAGDPLRPSRLLLQCADSELPERIAWLFRPVGTAQAAPSWRRAWSLKPRRVPMPRKVAVTALRAWLKCPFRFYLRYGLQMEAVDPTKSELDAMDFGTLCHAALEAMGREVGLRDCTDEGVLRGFLLDALDREAARRFGAELTLPLIVQLESARQRLSRAAAVQASTRAEGWVIEKVEEKFEIAVDELVVVGKIDRIERNEITGEYRVIDYKTSDRPVNPMEAHLRNLRRGESVPEFAFAGPGGEGPAWMDLQLPLYLRAVAVGGAPVSCAYFNLPKAAGETGIRPWTDYTRELESSAWRCAEGVAAAIVAGEFWPPNEDLRAEWDDYATLFHHGVADSIAWEEGAP
jgi:ATP-dependent helicase/nuclease subunit B